MAIFQGSWAVRTLLDTRSSLFLEVGLNRIVSAFPQALSPTSTLNQIGESSKTGTPPWRMLVRFKTSSKCPFQHWKLPPVRVSSSSLQKLAGGKHCSSTLSRWPELLEGQSKIHCIANRTPPTCFNSNRSYSHQASWYRSTASRDLWAILKRMMSVDDLLTSTQSSHRHNGCFEHGPLGSRWELTTLLKGDAARCFQVTLTAAIWSDSTSCGNQLTAVLPKQTATDLMVKTSTPIIHPWPEVFRCQVHLCITQLCPIND